MPNRTPRAKNKTHRDSTAPAGPPTISARWLAAAVGIAFVAAIVCAWAALCFVFWQGSWQLLYHPTKAVTRTPASVGLSFDAVGLAATEAGEAQLRGWWIPAAPDARFSRYTALYLHGADGNLGDTVDALAQLHAAGLNVLAFDYRGYGQSQFARPSETHWREDAASALDYLTGTRHIAINSIVIFGEDLGANLALEVAASHPELAGIVLQQPRQDAEEVIFHDPRARMVPAHALVHDRWNLNAPAARLRIPSLWLLPGWPAGHTGLPPEPQALSKIQVPKSVVWLTGPQRVGTDISRVLPQWLDDLDTHRGTASPAPK
jgi:uncharacterized protein